MAVVLAQLANGVVLGSIYALMAIGYTMVWNVLAFINWAHGEVYMMAAFVTVTLYGAGVSLLPAALLGVAGGTLTGVLMERIAYRPMRQAPKLNLLIGALGISIFLRNAAQLVWGPSPRRLPSPLLDRGLDIGVIHVSLQQVLILAVGVLAMALLQLFVRRTTLGRAMRAAAEDMETASLMGINTERVIVATFAIGSTLGGVAGVLIAPLYLVYPTMGVLAGLKGFTASVLGGMGSVTGAMVAGLVLGIAESLGAGFISSGYRDAVAMVVLLLVLLVRPEGLFGHGVLSQARQRA